MRKYCLVQFVALSFFLLTKNTAFAALDPEIIESAKCSRYFPYFEKRHKIPVDTLHSVSLQESGKSHSKHKIKIVWPWAVNVEGESYFFDTKFTAVSFVKKQLALGKSSIDVGCMQINLKHHPEAFSSIERAFDPATNIGYGAEFLRAKYDQYGHWHHAIANYHSATKDLGDKYKANVINIARNMPEYKTKLKSCIIAKDQPYNKNQLSSNTAYPDRFQSSKQYPHQIAGATKHGRVLRQTKLRSETEFSKRPDYERLRSNLMVRIPRKSAIKS